MLLGLPALSLRVLSQQFRNVSHPLHHLGITLTSQLSNPRLSFLAITHRHLYLLLLILMHLAFPFF